MGGRNVWGNTKSKIRRPINTVALPPGVMDSILEDVREFLEIEDWYVTAGIPHHRGYLLHGPPGTGKSTYL
jgi:chaperone BCS1